jgi:hypothetical protein
LPNGRHRGAYRETLTLPLTRFPSLAQAADVCAVLGSARRAEAASLDVAEEASHGELVDADSRDAEDVRGLGLAESAGSAATSPRAHPGRARPMLSRCA